MSDSEAKKELVGIARSVDALFTGGPPPLPEALSPEPPALPLPEVTAEPPPDLAEEPPTLAAPAFAGEPSPFEELSPFDALGVDGIVEPDGPALEEPTAGFEVMAEPEAASEAADATSSGSPFDPQDEASALERAVEGYLEGDRSKADEIRTLAAEMIEAREVDPVARSIGALAVAAGEPPDAEIIGLAEEIGSPIALGRLARHMGAERDETRREEYVRACRALGAPMAAAIREHLAEATDRLARRVHCDALVAMGPAGRATIEDMAQDENRFLVRNAVAILGETGGGRAVELVTSALAHPDAKVRKEALLSLARLEASESASLVVGFIEDPDPDVRVAAATAAGELKVERALRPLLGLLDAEKDPDVLVPVIRALGQLGDPGAVPTLEKHAVRSLFSKPPTEVRVASYRALHRIGSPHAKELVRAALEDKDGAVQAAARELARAERAK